MQLSIVLIRPHVKRGPLMVLQFDVQQKIKLILGKRLFPASDSSVITFKPENYTAKSNFMKLCRLCYDNEIGPGQKMRKKYKQITKLVSSMWFFYVLATLLTNFRFML